MPANECRCLYYRDVYKRQLNERRKTQGEKPMPAGEFLKMLKEKREVVGLDDRLLKRSVNEGFSGGEKKRNEIFQMAVLEPRLSILEMCIRDRCGFESHRPYNDRETYLISPYGSR